VNVDFFLIAVAMSNLMSLYRSSGVNDGKGLKACSCFLFIITGPLIENAFILNKRALL